MNYQFQKGVLDTEREYYSLISNGGDIMDKKPLYYDGSGDGEKLIQSEVVKKPMSIVTEVRKNLTGNPFVIDWSQVNVAGK